MFGGGIKGLLKRCLDIVKRLLVLQRGVGRGATDMAFASGFCRSSEAGCPKQVSAKMTPFRHNRSALYVLFSRKYLRMIKDAVDFGEFST